MRPTLLEGFPSGQRDQTVNLTAPPSVVRIHLPPPSLLKKPRMRNHTRLFAIWHLGGWMRTTDCGSINLSGTN